MPWPAPLPDVPIPADVPSIPVDGTPVPIPEGQVGPAIWQFPGEKNFWDNLGYDFAVQGAAPTFLGVYAPVAGQLTGRKPGGILRLPAGAAPSYSGSRVMHKGPRFLVLRAADGPDAPLPAGTVSVKKHTGFFGTPPHDYDPDRDPDHEAPGEGFE